MQTETIIAKEISDIMAIELPDSSSFESMKAELSSYINELIKHDFDKLVFLLYRIDVYESKLKEVLKINADAAAGESIAQLIIERQIEKMRSRQAHRKDISADDGEEKW